MRHGCKVMIVKYILNRLWTNKIKKIWDKKKKLIIFI